MKPRTCFVWLWIANDKGEPCRYSVRPLPAAELSPIAVAGFRLVNLSRDPSPEYRVRLLDGGEVACNCPQFDSAGACKHGDALLAAGLLPSALLGLLQERTKLLDLVEANLAAVSARAVQLQTALAAIPPKRPRRTRPRLSEAA